MSNLLTRSITGFFFILIMVGGILWNLWSYVALFALIALLGLWEFYTLLEKKKGGVQKFPGMALALILVAASSGRYFLPINGLFDFPGIEFIMLLFPIFMIIKLFSKETRLELFSPTLFGILFSVLPFCYILIYYSTLLFFEGGNNATTILGFFILMWTNDTFAYLTGISFGKNKLFERVSPKKTWEGFLGGLCCTQGVAYLLSIYFTDLAPLHWHMVGLIVSIFGTMGDLVESKLKRSLDVKDSGRMLPGHGGLLDRFDGILLSAPFVISYLMIVKA